QRSHRLVASRVADRNLEVIRGGATLNAAEANAIWPGLIQVNRGEIGYAIGSDVLCRIADFIEQLLLDRSNRHTSAGARMFGDGERAVRLGFHNRIADVGQVGDSLPI